MIIENTEVFGLDSSLRAMRFPMNYKGKPEDINGKSDEKLSQLLANCKSGSGHDSFLKGIIVKAEWIADHSFWLQEGRYHHIDIVSSESKMHSITKGSVSDSCHELVGNESLWFVKELIDVYNSDDKSFKYSYISARDNSTVILVNRKKLFEAIVMNLPIGFELRASIVTNYLQLKTMYNQRKNHKMSAWCETFRTWVENDLPRSELITKII